MPQLKPAEALIAAKDSFQTALLTWYRTHARKLPWREKPSLYKTVVSEFMLQQTQVKTVLPYFARWLDALPDFAALAGADESRVLKLWEGLGYYSRARNLHRLAKEIVGPSSLAEDGLSRSGTNSPGSSSRRGEAARDSALGTTRSTFKASALGTTRSTLAEWRELPGVGPYTAAAITSISFGEQAACVDGNVVRILARLTADATLYRDSATASKTFAPLANALVSSTAPGDHNQAMMELGATLCFRQKPLCLTCPVRTFCAAARSGTPESFPRLAPKQMEQRVVTRIWCERKGALLLHRSAANARRFANMHELPTAEHAGFTPAAVAVGELLARKRRGITRFQITESIYASAPPNGTRIREAGLVWIPLANLETITLSGPHRRWVSEILAERKKGGANAGES